jgi:MFS family permease
VIVSVETRSGISEPPSAPERDPGRVRAYGFYVLGLLTVVYTSNFIDRIVLGILVAPIKAELHLTDTQLGFLGGTAFALFYTALGIPVGRLADRMNRVWIMTAALACWSAFTAATGLAHGFMSIFVARLGVGVGEAGGVAPAYSLISDYFSPASRSRALAFYSVGIPLGSALGYFFGGYLATAFNWRAAFLLLGLVGMLLVPLLLATIREPLRGAHDPVQPVARVPSLREVWTHLAAKSSFWLLSFGAACGSIMGYGLLFWLPSFFMRSYGMTVLQVSHFLGALLLLGGIPGIALGGYLADRYGLRNPRVYALLPAIAFLSIFPCYAIGTSLSMGKWAFLFFLIPSALQLVWLGPVITAIQQLVPATMRAVASAIFLFINNLLGLGLGALLLGFASDQLAAHFGAASLRYAILGGTSFYLIAAILFFFASKKLPRDFEPTLQPQPLGSNG